MMRQFPLLEAFLDNEKHHAVIRSAQWELMKTEQKRIYNLVRLAFLEGLGITALSEEEREQAWAESDACQALNDAEV